MPEIMDHLRRDLIAQGFVEEEPGVFRRRNALGLPEEVRQATPEEATRYVDGKPRIDEGRRKTFVRYSSLRYPL